MKKNLPFILLLLINLIFGIMTADDFGESWDEAPMRSYANMSIKAYNLFFKPDQIGEYYGDEVMRYYGPAYIMLSRIIVSAITSVYKATPNTIYHFMNFSVFLLGLYFFYLISSRLFSKATAFCTTLLFNFQPLLWGHSFINPKDIPFMVFFLGTMAAGIDFCYKLPELTLRKHTITNHFEKFNKPSSIDLKGAKEHIRHYLLFFLGSLIFLIITVLINLPKTFFTFIFEQAALNPGSIWNKLFDNFARNRNYVSVESYIQKGITITNNLIILLGVLCILLPFIIFMSQLYKFPLIDMLSRLKKYVIGNFIKIKHLFSHFPAGNLSVISGISIIRTIVSNRWFWIASFMFGLCVSTRIMGLYAGLLIIALLFKRNWKYAAPAIVIFFSVSFLFVYLFWPYLWDFPFLRLVEAVSTMSNYPWDEKVLFNGIQFKTDHLPSYYIPELLLLQFTEPVVILALIGFPILLVNLLKKKISLGFFLLLFWFFFPVAYSIHSRTPIYDNFRHILFLIPPLFFVIGETLEFLRKRVNTFLFVVVISLSVIPGIVKIINLHPYEYVYYNSIIQVFGGIDKNFEKDYFGTSVKEAIEFLNTEAPEGATIFIRAPYHLATSEARSDLILIKSNSDMRIGNVDYSVNLDRFSWWGKNFARENEIYSVKRDGSALISVRRIERK